MLHLAQVQTKHAEGKVTLRLLAQQKAEHVWEVITEPETIPASEAGNYGEGMLVLVELSATHQVKTLGSATSWLLDVIEHYLSSGITPELLEQEGQRAEQWRQSLTLQSQELGRRALEMEARRDQIQELEENLKQEKKQIELMRSEAEARRDQIQELEENLKQEKKQVELMRLEAEARQDQIQELEDNLKREKKQLELLAAELKANMKSSAN